MSTFVVLKSTVTLYVRVSFARLTITSYGAL